MKIIITITLVLIAEAAIAKTGQWDDIRQPSCRGEWCEKIVTTTK
jgi:hypothetical protein